MALTDEDRRWIREELHSVREELVGRIEKTETALPAEFHKWASPAEARNRTISAALRAIDLEMDALSDRVKTLENRQ